MDLAREMKKTMELVSDANFNWRDIYSHRMIGIETGELGNKKTSGEHPNNSIVDIGQNTEKSPGDLRRHSVNQIPVENYQRTLVGKTLK